MPGESPAVFGDALKRLAAAATYLYQDGQRYWYSTQPTVTKLAEDRAEQFKREPDKVTHEIDRRLRLDLAKTGDFGRIHAMPQTGQDVPDDLDARLIVLSVDHPYSKDAGSAAELGAKAILESRGNTPRIYRNTLVFLAADKTRLQDLDEAARRYLAWESVLDDQVALNLDPQQVKQATTQKAAADGAVTARIPETYQWLLVPAQGVGAQAPITWEALRLAGTDPLAVRASKKLRNDELLLTAFGASRLRMELDRIPLWRGDSVPIRQLAEDFARYLYLPRLADPAVLVHAVRDGVGMLTWPNDSFAYADSYDETAGRYRGLCGGRNLHIADHTGAGLLVKPEIALKQLDAEVTVPGDKGTGAQPGGTKGNGEEGGESGTGGGESPKPSTPKPKRYHGTVSLDPTRVGRDAGRIADEVIVHLAGLVGAAVTVTLEIEAEIPAGAPDQVVRVVTENGRTLKFSNQGFEAE